MDALQRLAILKKPQVRALTKLGNTRLYDMIKKGLFPKPVLLGGARAVGWRTGDIYDWLNNLSAGGKHAAAPDKNARPDEIK